MDLNQGYKNKRIKTNKKSSCFIEYNILNLYISKDDVLKDYLYILSPYLIYTHTAYKTFIPSEYQNIKMFF